jgi:hypothetical protein
MARATKALITRQDLIDMDKDGLILLRPGSGIESSGEYINKVLTREEMVQFAYLDCNPFDTGDNSGIFVLRQISTGPETFVLPPGFLMDTVTEQAFVPGPIIDGKRANGGSVISTYITVPADRKRMTHYGVDARFHDTIVSPALDLYGKTIHINNQRANTGLFTAALYVGKDGTTPTATYTRSNVGSTDLSGNIRLGNLVNFSLVPPGVWLTGGFLTMEVFENSVLQYSKTVYISANSSTILSLKDYKIKFGVNYEFKGSSITISEFTGAYSNVTGQRACNSYLLNEQPPV